MLAQVPEIPCVFRVTDVNAYDDDDDDKYSTRKNKLNSPIKVFKYPKFFNFCW